MMMSSSDDKMGKTTPSPSVSSEPTYIESYYPTSSNGKEGMMMSKMSKEVPTVSPSISLVPSITAVPTLGGDMMMMMGMKMGMDDKNNKNENMIMKKGKGGMSMSKITLPPSPTTTVPTTPPNVVLVPTNGTYLSYPICNRTIPNTSHLQISHTHTPVLSHVSIVHHLECSTIASTTRRQSCHIVTLYIAICLQSNQCPPDV